jgi:branched-chain amino acid transport system ATP-binding protein
VGDAALDEALAMLHEIGLNDRADTRASTLSHGEQRRLELAMALVTKPIVLILDEPMAGTSPDETQSLTKLLLSLKRRYAILLIEHDMQAVFALADRISVLVGGKIIASGLPEIVRTNADVQAAYLGREKEPEHA